MSDAIKERPILFSAPMINALLQGRKTMTRRAVNPQPPTKPMPCHYSKTGWAESDGDTGCQCSKPVRYPYGWPGERLWVRETFTLGDKEPCDCISGGVCQHRPAVHFRADWGGIEDDVIWRPSIFMPRWASRITLEISDVRVERLQEISEEDAIAEGMREFGTTGMFGYDLKGTPGPMVGGTAREAFALLWEKINGPGSWAANPWVWCVSFVRIQG